jgi:hypothetical protein
MSDVQEYPAVYIDSDREQEAWLVATLGPMGTWRSMAQTLRITDDGQQQEILEVERESGERMSIPFMEATPDDSLEGEGYDRTAQLDDMMSLASQYAEQNPPNHPGSLPRFPVPSRSYAEAVSIPMAVLAVDDIGRRGLYAPPRQVAISLRDETLVGVGEFPGFDPEHWPPPRLGDWPPASIAQVPHEQLTAMIARFNACWSRVLESWFAQVSQSTPILRADIEEALRYRGMLDLPAFEAYYERLNPVFAKWLRDMTAS